MKNQFRHYYRLTDDEFRTLWTSCIFVPDANVLLNFYRYSESTREHLFELCSALRDRLWLPYQAALEFHDNRLQVIATQIDACDGFRTSCSTLIKSADELRSHPFLSDRLSKNLRTVLRKIGQEIEVTTNWLRSLYQEDPILDRITLLVSGKTGASLPPEELDKVPAEADARYKLAIPPGYKDKDKPAPKRYGDYIAWKELLAYAAEAKKPVIFVTDDDKDDWWRKHEGRTVGPHPALRKEFETRSGTMFYMYHVDQFMQYAQEYAVVGQTPDKTAIREATVTRQQREAALRNYAAELEAQERALREFVSGHHAADWAADWAAKLEARERALRGFAPRNYAAELVAELEARERALRGFVPPDYAAKLVAEFEARECALRGFVPPDYASTFAAQRGAMHDGQSREPDVHNGPAPPPPTDHDAPHQNHKP